MDTSPSYFMTSSSFSSQNHVSNTSTLILEVEEEVNNDLLDMDLYSSLLSSNQNIQVQHQSSPNSFDNSVNSTNSPDFHFLSIENNNTNIEFISNNTNNNNSYLDINYNDDFNRTIVENMSNNYGVHNELNSNFSNEMHHYIMNAEAPNELDYDSSN
jgi:hypothetical protein